MTRTLLLLPLLAACGPGIPNGADEAVLNCTVLHGDPVEVQTGHVEGDTLLLEVSYAGGCKEHELYTCWSGDVLGPEEYNPANPHRIEIGLGHDAHGDKCEEITTETLSFDLTDLRDDYETTHPDPGDSLVLIVDDVRVQYALQ